jgi:hypothetical protein
MWCCWGSAFVFSLQWAILGLWSALPMPSGAVLQMYISMSQYAVRPLLVALWPTGHAAPVEQCCLCLVGHIRYVACGAELCPVGPSYRCIYSMSQYAVRFLLSAFWPTGYVAPVEQCCICPVGLIRYIALSSATYAQWLVLQMYIFNVTVCRAASACSVMANRICSACGAVLPMSSGPH